VLNAASEENDLSFILALLLQALKDFDISNIIRSDFPQNSRRNIKELFNMLQLALGQFITQLGQEWLVLHLRQHTPPT